MTQSSGDVDGQAEVVALHTNGLASIYPDAQWELRPLVWLGFVEARALLHLYSAGYCLQHAWEDDHNPIPHVLDNLSAVNIGRLRLPIQMSLGPIDRTDARNAGRTTMRASWCDWWDGIAAPTGEVKGALQAPGKLR